MRLTSEVTHAPVVHVLPSGRELRLTIRNEGDFGTFYTMEGGHYGEHALSADPHHTPEKRLKAHWRGYVELNEKHPSEALPEGASTKLPRRYVNMTGSHPDARTTRTVKWSHPKPPPAVGEYVFVPQTWSDGEPLGFVTVSGYAVEYGWLYLVTRPHRPGLRGTETGHAYVAGIDL